MAKKLVKSILSLAVVLVLLLPISVNIPTAKAAPINATLINQSSGTELNFSVGYGGSGTKINAGDTIVLTMAPSVSGLIKIYAFAPSSPIYNSIHEEVGTREYSTDAVGNCTLTLTFNSAYEGLDDVSGWYEASAYISYIGTVTENDVTVKITLNDVEVIPPIEVPAGSPGFGPGGKDFTPGAFLSKYWRYAENSGNEATQDTTGDGDYTKLKELRWFVPIGYSTITYRDLRANSLINHDSTGFYTTDASIAYSNDTPYPSAPYDVYDKVNEPYLNFWYWSGSTQIFNGPDNEPYYLENVFLDDYLDVGEYSSTYSCSPHDYIKDSIRIVRIIGRGQSDADYFDGIADGNFLITTGGVNIQEIFRFPGQSPFPGYRGLTVEEFFYQMQSEGQFSGYSSWEDILEFTYVDNKSDYYLGYSNLGAGDSSIQIPHFQLNLGDMHFYDDYTGMVTGVTRSGSVWDTVPAKNLPYAYLVYYDTTATGIELNTNSTFGYFNRATLTYGSDKFGMDYVPVGMRYEASGGSGSTPASIKIKKTDISNDPIQGIEFKLTSTDGYSQSRTTAADGTLSFIINMPGTYTLTEITPIGKNLKAIEPLTFIVEEGNLAAGKINLVALLPSGYDSENDFSYVVDTNVIINHDSSSPPTTDPKPEPESTEITLSAKKTANGNMLANQFSFTLYESNAAGDNLGVKATVMNTSEGSASDIVFPPIEYTEENTYYYLLMESGINSDSTGWDMDTSKYLITVDVENDGHGKLVATSSISKWDGQQWASYTASNILFENSYTEPSPSPSSPPSPSSSPPTSPSPSPSPSPSSSPSPSPSPSYEPPTDSPTVIPSQEPEDGEPEGADESEFFEQSETRSDEIQHIPGGYDYNIPPIPITQGNIIAPGEDGIYYEHDENGIPLGEWRWDDDEEMWLFDEYPPLSEMPMTGDYSYLVFILLIFGILLLCTGISIKYKRIINNNR